MRAICNWIMARFTKPTAEMISAAELAQARRDLIEHERARDFYSHMVGFDRQRIVRLRELLSDNHAEKF
jgi:hypothetical protein